ncbi:MAG: MBL fold metallo-hydrolase [Candidatus Woesearchaeota archaeon]
MTSITFLGTGGDIYVISKCIRNSSGIVIRHEDLQFVIDPGPNTLLTARNNNINLRATTAVICTSPKLMMSNDINATIAAMTYNGEDVHGVVVAPKTLVEGNQLNQPLLRQFYKGCVERVIIAEPEKKIGIENVDIHFKETTLGSDNVGLILIMSDIKIGYTSTTGYNERIAKQYDGCDVLIMHIQNPSGMQEKNRMSSDDAIKFINKVKPQLAIITHFGKSMLENDSIQEARFIHSKTDCQVLAAVDGQTISPVSYDAKGKQKNLKQFQ